ncbi:hypothetical protein JXB41_02305 [Candidatus Woesearchaeota archaeon]|nr:hypothetical protein [Candidatus Woesearchaeota archaeon]
MGVEASDEIVINLLESTYNLADELALGDISRLDLAKYNGILENEQKTEKFEVKDVNSLFDSEYLG